MNSSRPSDTAKLIARSLYLASQDPRLKALVSEDAVPALRQILGGQSGRDWIFPISQSVAGREFLRCCERVFLPGILTHYLVRKAKIADLIEDAIAGGCQQVVVIGGGFDVLAWRLHVKYPGVSFVELDHPATQAEKKGFLEVGPNFRFCTLDLVKQLPSEVLEKTGTPIAFVIEGVTMYLTPERVGELMRDVASTMGAGGRVVWTFMEQDEEGEIDFRNQNRLVSWWLKHRSEPFLWGETRDRIAGFLSSCGLKQEELIDHDELRRDYLTSHGLDDFRLAEGELISTAISI